MTKAPSVAEMMSAYAQDSVEYAQRLFDISLDYSEGSVQQVETVLAKLFETTPKGTPGKSLTKAPSQRDIEQMAKMSRGLCRGSDAARVGGERWKLESAAFPGQQVITLEIARGGDIWPHFKVGKRLTNGPEDNLWTYFQVLKQKYQKQH